MHDKILIVDFGSQVTQLIARRVREEGVYCEIVPFQKADGSPCRDDAESGDPVGRTGLRARPRSPVAAARALPRWTCRSSASATASRRWRSSSAARLRAAIIASSAAPRFEVTQRRTRCLTASGEVGEAYPVWMSHGDRMTRCPTAFARSRPRPTRRSPRSPTKTRRFYATQFHPEVVHTPRGAALLRNFVRNIAGCAGDWTMHAFRDEAIEQNPPGRSARAA